MERTVVVKAVGSAITPPFGEDSGQAWRCGPREGRAAPPGAQCQAPAARWRPLPADSAFGGGADKGGRSASPALRVPRPRGRGGGWRPGWPRPPLRVSPAAAARAFVLPGPPLY